MSTTSADQATVSVREGTRADMPQLAAMLAAFFESCPGWEWFLPRDSKDRRKRMERFFAYLLDRFYLRDGRDCFTTDERDGAALWDPPDGWKLGAGDNLRLLSVMLPVFRARVARPVRALGAFDAKHPSEPHYYLSVFGAAPGSGKRGVAEALLRTGLERCDRERMPAYTETGLPHCRDLYVRHGFEVLEELNLPGGGPPAWRLWREPRD
jgi:GNAT superfamily N-acetyltransferase